METVGLMRSISALAYSVRNPLLSERDGNYIYIVQVLFIRSMLSETHYSLKEMETLKGLRPFLLNLLIVRNPLLSERDGNNCGL